MALAMPALATLLIAGCAAPTGAGGHFGSDAQPATAWSGRLSLRIDSDPVQTFSALFELRGTARAGELTLTSPIGNTLAALSWSPGEALLDDGRQTRRFDSVDALAEAATGAALPVGTLFDWLAGRAVPVAGWRADLRQVAEGRLQAVREAPRPTAELRLVFERQ